MKIDRKTLEEWAKNPQNTQRLTVCEAAEPPPKEGEIVLLTDMGGNAVPGVPPHLIKKVVPEASGGGVFVNLRAPRVEAPGQTWGWITDGDDVKVNWGPDAPPSAEAQVPVPHTIPSALMHQILTAAQAAAIPCGDAPAMYTPDKTLGCVSWAYDVSAGVPLRKVMDDIDWVKRIIRAHIAPVCRNNETDACEDRCHTCRIFRNSPQPSIF